MADPAVKRRRLSENTFEPIAHTTPPPLDDSDQPKPSGTVCFGSLILYPARRKNDGGLFCSGLRLSLPGEAPSSSTRLHVGDKSEHTDRESSVIGEFQRMDTELLELFHREGIEFDTDLVRDPSEIHREHHKDSLAVTVTLYGPGDGDFGTRLGETLQDLDLDLYLQDPVFKGRDVPYRNPHKFAVDDGILASSFPLKPRNLPLLPVVEEISGAVVDIVANFVSEDKLPETPGSPYLRTSLASHQRRGLTFMLRREREQSWRVRNNADIWSVGPASTGSTKPSYRNNITGFLQNKKPGSTRGGLQCDHMGLGKTLSILALIAHDKFQPQRNGKGGLTNLKPTLVVMPHALLATWQSEIETHLKASHFKWTAYQGAKRQLGSQEAKRYDIILTTYPTLASDWQKHHDGSFLFKLQWHRVVLDEAHYVKNPSTLVAKAAYALDASRRWAVTGTPIQNSLSEMQSLFRFLKICPYEKPEYFTRDITREGLSGPESTGVRRLKTLLQFIMLRRQGNVLGLPKRTDKRISVPFSPEERRLYEQAKGQAIQCKDQYMFSRARHDAYFNVLTKINHLRQLCNLGCRASRQLGAVSLGMVGRWSTVTAQHAFIELLDSDPGLVCDRCDQPVELLDTVWLSQCLSIRCPSCVRSVLSSQASPRSCTCQPSACLAVELSLPLQTADDDKKELNSQVVTLSSKIMALVNDLRTVPQHVKSVVFSSWTSTLDLAHEALDREGIQCVQIDGKRTSKYRDQDIAAFRDTPQIRVLLVSINCGAVGLTLTEASRAYLMESLWNPSQEEQALARVYRIGQTKEVTTVRFIIEDTIEKHVVEIQNGKESLVKSIFSKTRDGERAFESLKRLLQ